MLAAALIALAPLASGEARADAPAVVAKSGPLGLDEVVDSAVARFPLVIAALADLDAARGDARAADGAFDPTLRSTGTLAAGAYPSQRIDVIVEQPTPLWGASVFAGYRVGLGSFPVYDGKLQTNQYGEIRGGVRVPLLRDGYIDRRRATIRRADLGVDVAKLSVEQQKLEVARLAAQRYWDWVAAGRRVAAARAWLALATSRDADLATRVERGDIPALERAENQRSLLQRRAALASYERALAEAANELSLYLRDGAGAPITPSASRLPPGLPDAAPFDASRAKADEAAAPDRRPDVARVEAQRAQAKVDVELAKNQRLPALDVLLFTSKDFGPGDPKLDKPVFEAGFSFELPIPGRGPGGRAQAAEAIAGRLDAQARLARDRVLAEVRNASVAVETAAERTRLAKQEYAVAEQLAEGEADRFKLGESNLLLVNLREQAAAEAAIRQVDALADYHKAVAAYRAAVGLAR
jgi:outer membrane protein TolC